MLNNIHTSWVGVDQTIFILATGKILCVVVDFCVFRFSGIGIRHLKRTVIGSYPGPRIFFDVFYV